MPLIKLKKGERIVIVPELLAEALQESGEAVFLDVVETESEVRTRHIKEKKEAAERVKIERKRQQEEMREARRNERIKRQNELKEKRDEILKNNS